MFFYKKIWLIAEIILLIIWLVCRFLIPTITKCLTTMFLSIGNNVTFNSNNLIPIFKNLNQYAINGANKSIYFLKIMIFIISLWFLVDCLNGQLKRDIKSATITKFLTRNIDQNSLSVIMSEEKEANKWIKRGRIIRWKKKMIFIMPIMANSTVFEIIKDRCDENLVSSLSEGFKTVNWTPLLIKKGGLIKWIFVKQK